MGSCALLVVGYRDSITSWSAEVQGNRSKVQDVNVHSSQLRTPLRTIVFSVMSTLYELVWLTNLEMTLDRNARRMRLSRFPPRRVQSNTAQCREYGAWPIVRIGGVQLKNLRVRCLCLSWHLRSCNTLCSREGSEQCVVSLL